MFLNQPVTENKLYEELKSLVRKLCTFIFALLARLHLHKKLKLKVAALKHLFTIFGLYEF